MLNYTTCADCREILAVTYVGQVTHPGCQQTEAEKLALEFVQAVQRHDEAEADRLEKMVLKADAPANLGKSALWYASQGWPAFPLLPGGKEPAIRQGFKMATTNPDEIRSWWTKHPESNIGLATGEMFDVIDVDGPQGIKTMSELADGKLPPVHGKVSTPRGLHLYVTATGDGNRAGVLPGIDYRGKGGYVVAPPSQVDFKRYRWLMQPSPEIRNK